MAKKRKVAIVHDDKSSVHGFIPRMSSYGSIHCECQKHYLKRPAKFAPELLAVGLSNGIVQSSNVLMHGVFDDPDATNVDPHCDISSDKFAMLQDAITIPNLDPKSLEPNQ